MDWHLSHRFDRAARPMADRHYNRRAIGSPQFVPPGRCVVLVIPGSAFWVTSWPFAEYVRHAWPGAWVSSAFRNERRDLHLSSDLCWQAIAATRFYWEPPKEGMISFVDPTKTKRKRDPGRCYRRAGFHLSGTQPCCANKPGQTAGGLIALHLGSHQMPEPCAPIGQTLELIA